MAFSFLLAFPPKLCKCSPCRNSLARLLVVFMGISTAQIQAIVPNTPLRVADEVVAILNPAAVRYEINTPRRLAAFIAHVAFKSKAFALRPLKISAAAALWQAMGLNYFADRDDLHTLARRLDPTLTGYGAIDLIYDQALKVLSDPCDEWKDGRDDSLFAKIGVRSESVETMA